MADFTQIQHETPPLAYWNPALERCDGALESDALPDATDLFQPIGLQGVVRQPVQLEYKLKLVSKLGGRVKATINPQTFPPAPHEA